MRNAAFAAALLLAAGPGAAASEPPAALIEATERSAAECKALGGVPEILSRYETIRDLNGDGRDDFLTDLAYLQCSGAWSAFCGSGGCPVSAWLSEPGDGYTRFDFGYLIGFEVRDRGGDLPQVVAHYQGSFCDDAGRINADHCTRTWTFTDNAPDEPPVDPGAEPATAAAAAAEKVVPATAPAPPVIPPGWTLRRVSGSSPVAVAGGTGSIASLATFCLAGQPFLAVSFATRPEADKAALAFDFSQGKVEVSAGFEPTAGGAFVLSLSDGQLAERLAGRDKSVPVAVDGADQGMLSLAGSTKALRGAMADCRGQ